MDDGKWWCKKVFVSLGIFSAIGWCYDILAMIPPDALHVLDCLLVVCVIDSSRVIPILLFLLLRFHVSCPRLSPQVQMGCVLSFLLVVIFFALVALASATHHAAWGRMNRWGNRWRRRWRRLGLRFPLSFPVFSMKTFYGVIYTIERDWLLLFIF